MSTAPPDPLGVVLDNPNFFPLDGDSGMMDDVIPDPQDGELPIEPLTRPAPRKKSAP
jgi:hypothetical protein